MCQSKIATYKLNISEEAEKRSTKQWAIFAELQVKMQPFVWSSNGQLRVFHTELNNTLSAYVCRYLTISRICLFFFKTVTQSAINE